MNVFIYDDFLKKHQKVVNNIEISLHKLNLNGKIIYLESVRNLFDAIKDEINNGARTIVAVGDDRTVNKVLNAMMNNPATNPPALGIIPVGAQNSIAQACGVINEREAGQILLARRMAEINVGKANKQYFLAQAKIKAKGTTIKIADFSINQTENGEINLINLPTKNCSTKNILVDPNDGKINLFIENGRNKYSAMAITELEIENGQEEKLLLDNVLEIETPAKISLSEQKINIIVGKNRIFNLIN